MWERGLDWHCLESCLMHFIVILYKCVSCFLQDVFSQIINKFNSFCLIWFFNSWVLHIINEMKLMVLFEYSLHYLCTLVIIYTKCGLFFAGIWQLASEFRTSPRGWLSVCRCRPRASPFGEVFGKLPFFASSYLYIGDSRFRQCPWHTRRAGRFRLQALKHSSDTNPRGMLRGLGNPFIYCTPSSGILICDVWSSTVGRSSVGVRVLRPCERSRALPPRVPKTRNSQWNYPYGAWESWFDTMHAARFTQEMSVGYTPIYMQISSPSPLAR